MNTPAKPARFTLLFEILDIQVFNADRCIGVNILAGEFVQEISLLVRDMIIDPLQFTLCLLPVLREPLFPSNALLQLLDLLQRMLMEPRVLDHCPVAIDCKRGQTEIDPDRSPLSLRFGDLLFRLNDHIPSIP